MSLHAHSLSWRPDLLPAAAVLPPELGPRATGAAGHPAPTRRETSTLPRAIQTVGLLAFGQSLLFLAFWLLCCAFAGAAPTKEAKDAKPAKSMPEVRPSVYAPTVARDPFLPTGATVVSKAGVKAAANDFNLQGILYHPITPSAMINNSLVELNKPVTVQTSTGKLQIRALEIARTSVKLQVGEQTIDLHLEPPKTPSPASTSNTNAPSAVTSATVADPPPLATERATTLKTAGKANTATAPTGVP